MMAMAPRPLPPALEATKAVQVPLRRFRAAQARLESAQDGFDQTRRQAVDELLAAGLSYAQIAELIGLTKSRVYQIAKGTR